MSNIVNFGLSDQQKRNLYIELALDANNSGVYEREVYWLKKALNLTKLRKYWELANRPCSMI